MLARAPRESDEIWLLPSTVRPSSSLRTALAASVCAAQPKKPPPFGDTLSGPDPYITI